jgi:hypothetical protein
LIRARFVQTDSGDELVDKINLLEAALFSKFPQFSMIFVEPDNNFEDFCYHIYEKRDWDNLSFDDLKKLYEEKYYQSWQVGCFEFSSFPSERVALINLLKRG